MKKTFISKEEKEYYDIVVEEWEHFSSADATVMTSAYTKDGLYLGNVKHAQNLVKRGIRTFEKIKGNNCVCSIGFNHTEQKWYGWSHRAIYGFGIGSTCKKGDCHYYPSNPQELIDELNSQYNDSRYYRNLTHTTKDNKVIITYEECYSLCDTTQTEEDLNNGQSVKYIGEEWVSKTEEFTLGKGEWVALTLEDAKQMAIDFSNGVS